MKKLSITVFTLSLIILYGCFSKVVYENRPFSPAQSQWGNRQIFRMNSDGSNPENLSNRNRDEYAPDVRHDGEMIVLLAGFNELHVMDIDGNGVSTVPGAPVDAGAPRWSRGESGPFFLLFSHPQSQAHAAIYRIFPDGTGLTQVTTPGATQTDVVADSMDDKHIVFTRFDTANSDWDLYVKYIWDNRPEVRLTNTPNQAETLPVVSHNGKMLAFRVVLGINQDDQIHVAGFTSATSFTVIHVIDLNLPADKNINGIDFSADDEELFISTQAADVPGNLVDRKTEIFRVRLDGSNQLRLTNNSDEDIYPSSVP